MDEICQYPVPELPRRSRWGLFVTKTL